MLYNKTVIRVEKFSFFQQQAVLLEESKKDQLKRSKVKCRQTSGEICVLNIYKKMRRDQRVYVKLLKSLLKNRKESMVNFRGACCKVSESTMKAQRVYLKFRNVNMSKQFVKIQKSSLNFCRVKVDEQFMKRS